MDSPEYSLGFINSMPSPDSAGAAVNDRMSDTELLDAYSEVVTGVVARVGPAVVHVRVSKKAPRRLPSPADVEGSGTVNSVDDIHHLLTKEAIGKNLAVVLLRDWTKRLEMSVVPAESLVL